MAEAAAAHGERLLDTPANPISIAITLDGLQQQAQAQQQQALQQGAEQQRQGAAKGSVDIGDVHASGAAAVSAECGGEQPSAAPAAAARAAPVSTPARGGGSGKPRSGPTFFGAMLWMRGVSGTRVVAPGGAPQTVAGLSFADYGAHCAGYGHAYLTAAAALGTRRGDVDELAVRLGRAFGEAARRCV